LPYPVLDAGDLLMAPRGVSVVTTTWNEKENIEKLIPLIRDVLRDTPHELIAVDDELQGKLNLKPQQKKKKPKTS
jgi:hypothetical protein